MKKLSVHVTSNPFLVSSKQCPCEYRKVRVSRLVYSPATTASNNITLKIDTSGKFDQNVEYSTGQEYFYIMSIPKDNTIGWTNVSHCNDWEYCSNQLKVLSDFQIKIYENDSLVSSAHLADYPLDIELTFKE